MASSVIIAPSILAGDYSKLGEEARRAEASGADWLHVDIMDGHFVNNISFGPGVTAAIGKASNLPMDVHLMIQHPDRYLEAFLKAKPDRLIVHVEATHDVKTTLDRIHQSGCKAGIALNPATPKEAVVPYLNLVDLVLCMTVVPGFGGQSFMPEVLPKIEFFKNHPVRNEIPYHIEVDGGIQLDTAVKCARAGADVMVAGTSLYGASDMKEAVSQMRIQAGKAMLES